MQKIKLLLIGMIILVSSCNKPSGLLIEAESFDLKGGWVVDPQFIEQMGSPYLMAHGMGIPVVDASTEIIMEEAGKYKIWVRTINWAPGSWDAPGVFHVAINDQLLPNKLGALLEQCWF